MTYTYIPKGVCSRKMTVELNDDHTIQAVRVEGGCNGNLQGISRLVVGMDAQEAIRRMRGIQCGFKPTSRSVGHSAGAGAAAGVSAMSQFFELHYHLPEDPARLFDVAQGLAGRRSILKRGGTVKVKPFTETCRRLLFQCIAFAVLTALAAVLVWAFHAKLKVLFFLCLVMSLVTFWTYQAGRMGYRKSWTQFRKDNRPDGTVTFTASGIREWNASDHTERFTWEQWDCCIISREVIVLTFHQPMLVLLPYTQESESTVVQALNAFGKQDTIYKI